MTVPGRPARVYSGMTLKIRYVAVLVVHADYNKTTAPENTPAMAMVDLSTRCLPNYSRKVASLSSVLHLVAHVTNTIFLLRVSSSENNFVPEYLRCFIS